MVEVESEELESTLMNEEDLENSGLRELVDKGNTVIVIEHNLDVIKTADYVIDIGPEGGDRGGNVVCQGPPEHIKTVKESDWYKILDL